MKMLSRAAALGIAGAFLPWFGRDAAAQAPPTPAPTARQSPRNEKPANQDVVRTSQEAAETTESPTANPLDDLAWIIGDWVDADEDSTVEASVAWTKNNKFLRRMFRVTPAEGEPHAGMQLIGWDAAEKTIRSWTFDADGGFGEERWSRDGDRWTIRSRYTLPDGARGTATNIMRRINDDSFTWRSVNRTMGGAIQPDIDEVIVIRKDAETTPTETIRPESGDARPSPSTPEPEKQP